jgi:hypothetical protein
MIIEGKKAGLVSSAFTLWKILAENIIDSGSKKLSLLTNVKWQMEIINYCLI